MNFSGEALHLTPRGTILPMARRYQTEELLRLRDSPLVSKPEKLPPAEEWMGPFPDPATQRKSTISREHNSNSSEPAARRPSLFEARHVSRNSGSEDIVLGPPKTSFASASRVLGHFGKSSTDVNDKPPRGHETEEGKSDRSSFREKFYRDRDLGERDKDKDFEKRDAKFGPSSGRRGGRDERDDWSHQRPRRTYGQEDSDRRSWRNGDSDRWEHRDQADTAGDRANRDRDGRFSRRDGARGRHDQQWFRDEAPSDSLEGGEERPSFRTREWRRDRPNAPDREWNRGARFEQDPEWMDSTDREESKNSHTQEDFQRWKEKMKAGAIQNVKEKEEPSVEKEVVTTHKEEAKHLDGELFNPAFQKDSSLDTFFGLLSEKKHTQDVSPPVPIDSAGKDTSSTKAAKSSRFAGFFSPSGESSAKEEILPKAQSDRPVSTEADQEGFQRILQMLGNSKSRNTTPQVDSSKQPRPPSLGTLEQSNPPANFSSLGKEEGGRGDRSNQENNGRNKLPSGFETLSQSHTAREANMQSRDKENLLRLMQQINISSVPQQSRTHIPNPNDGPIPGILNVPDLLSHPPAPQKAHKAPAFLDDPAIAHMQRPDGDINEQARRSGRDIQMGYIDDGQFANLPHSAQTPGSHVGGRGLQGHVQPPMGLQRPPGFEQMPPPGWPGQQYLPHQGRGPSPLAPPPGIPNPSRGMNPNFLPGPMPLHGNMPPPGDRQTFSRGNASGTFGPPPGMMPPPGYMNMNGLPPSGFQPMPHGADPRMNFPFESQGNFGRGATGPAGPQPQPSRHLLDMFSQVNSGDTPGGLMGPGHL